METFRVERSADGVSCTVSAILQSFPSILRSAAVTRPACEWNPLQAQQVGVLTVFSCWLWNVLNFVGCGLVTGHISSLRCCRVLVLQVCVCGISSEKSLIQNMQSLFDQQAWTPQLFAPFTQQNVIDAVSLRFHPGVTIQFDYWMSSSHWDKRNLRCQAPSWSPQKYLWSNSFTLLTRLWFLQWGKKHPHRKCMEHIHISGGKDWSTVFLK